MRDPNKCSFCNKARREVAFLIAAEVYDEVAICDECIGLCMAIVLGQARELSAQRLAEVGTKEGIEDED